MTIHLLPFLQMVQLLLGELKEYGGDSRAVQDQLRNVQEVQAAHTAFAALTKDGSVVTWGNKLAGGDSTAVQDQLRNVQQIQAAMLSFAAILADGSVITWGDKYNGGDSSAVHDQLRNVQQIQAAIYAFAAIRADRSVVTWGSENYGGDSSAVQEQLRNVQQIQAASGAFCCYSCKWIRCYLGWWGIWRQQHQSSRSTEGCPTNSSQSLCFWCNPYRWINRLLGPSVVGWWQHCGAFEISNWMLNWWQIFAQTPQRKVCRCRTMECRWTKKICQFHWLVWFGAKRDETCEMWFFWVLIYESSIWDSDMGLYITDHHSDLFLINLLLKDLNSLSPIFLSPCWKSTLHLVAIYFSR